MSTVTTGSKLRLPPYGKALMERRRSGEEPERIVLIFGTDWFYDGPHPRIAIKPREYHLRAYDLRVCAGLPVDILDRDRDLDSVEFDGDEAIFWLGAEVSKFACEVMFRFPRDDVPVVEKCEIEEAAFCKRTRTLRGVTWPAWWPSHIRDDYRKRNERYWADKAAELASICR